MTRRKRRNAAPPTETDRDGNGRWIGFPNGDGDSRTAALRRTSIFSEVSPRVHVTPVVATVRRATGQIPSGEDRARTNYKTRTRHRRRRTLRRGRFVDDRTDRAKRERKTNNERTFDDQEKFLEKKKNNTTGVSVKRFPKRRLIAHVGRGPD